MSESLGYPAWSWVVILLAIPIYYGFVAARVNSWITDALVDRVNLTRRYSHIEVTAILRLAVAGVLQACFLGLLVMVGQFGWSTFFVADWRPVWLLYGVLLGVGEMALGSFLSNISMRVVLSLRPKGGPADLHDWFTLSRGGWMRSFLTAIKITPLPVAIVLILLYVGVEEAVFRGVIMSAVRPWGEGWALAASILLFTAAQTFHMPRWQNALFPVIGALVVGVIHGVLYLAIPDVSPLIVAHAVLFMAATG